MAEPARRPTLLIVDDEVRILTALRRSLRREGWEILVADSPDKALALIEDHDIDVVLSDQKMRGMSGLELLEIVKERSPHTRLLLITGWTGEVPEAVVSRLRLLAVIQKPWDDEELKGILRRAMGTSA